MKANVEIYTWSHCPFSARAKELLQRKEVKYVEYCIDGDDLAREAMSQRANGHRTMPQIFIDNLHIGGCDELHILEEMGRLDTMLHQGKMADSLNSAVL